MKQNVSEKTLQEEVEELRQVKLKEWKISTLAEYKDRIDTIKKETDERIKQIEKKIEKVLNAEFIDVQEGQFSIYK